MKVKCGVSLVVLFCLAGSSLAQVTIHFSDFPYQIGAELIRGHGDNTIAPGLAGEAMSWDYSTLPTAYDLTESFVDPTGQPGAETFPEATLAQTNAFDGTVGEIGYFREVNNNIEMVGFVLISGGTPYPVPSQVNGPRFQFPITYGSSWDYVGTTVFGSETHIDSTHFVADAWGTMTEAAGTFACLRLRMNRTHTVLPTRQVHTTIRYMWVAKNWGEVCIISSDDNEIDPNFANGDYERISSNTHGTPVMFSFFEASYRDGGVDLDWLIREPQSGLFTLSGQRGDRTWPVALTAGDGGRYSARDETAWLQAGGDVVYALSLDGEIVYTSTVSVDVPTAPAVLWDAVPNPFNPQTVITFSIDRVGHVELGIYDLTGRRVATLADRTFPAGSHDLTWQGLDATGKAMPSGVYVVRMRTNRTAAAKKITLMR
jgi:hypothetical protein